MRNACPDRRSLERNSPLSGNREEEPVEEGRSSRPWGRPSSTCWGHGWGVLSGGRSGS